VKPNIPVKPERPKVRYFLDERELNSYEVERLLIEKNKSVSDKSVYDGSNLPIKPVKPAVQYR